MTKEEFLDNVVEITSSEEREMLLNEYPSLSELVAAIDEMERPLRQKMEAPGYTNTIEVV